MKTRMNPTLASMPRTRPIVIRSQPAFRPTLVHPMDRKVRGWGVPLILLLAGALVLLNLTGIRVSAAAVRASLDRETVPVGEAAALTLTFEGGHPNQPPSISSPGNLSIQYSGHSSQISIVNGQTSSAMNFTYSVIPGQVGDWTIPGIRVRVGNEVLTTPPLKLRAVAATDAARDQNGNLSRYAFLKLLAPRTNLFVGEVLPIEVQLYVTAAEQVQIPQLQSEGFSFGPMVQPPPNQAPAQVQVNGTIYRVLSFKTTAIPATAGPLRLGPAQCGLILRIPVNRRARDPLDEFFDFGPRSQRQPATLKSEEIPIQVLPIPTSGRPSDFGGAVGAFNWTVTAGPTNVMAGDPVTLKIQIAGEGSFDRLALPEYQWTDFKSYPPNAKVEATDPLGNRGMKTFEQVVVPQNSDVRAIPPISFSFFDPQARAFRTLRHPAIPLTVKASAHSPAKPTVTSGAAPASEGTEQTQDIVHIKASMGVVAPLPTPLLARPWFRLLFVLPPLLWAFAWGWRRRLDSLKSNPRHQRRLVVADLVRNGLRELHAAAAADQGSEFFAIVFRLLQEQLGERLDLPASAITESALDERLAPRGAPPGLVSELHALFQLCNQARYAGHWTTEELLATIPKVQAALDALRDFNPH